MLWLELKSKTNLPEAVTGDVDHGIIVGARHGCCPELHSWGGPGQTQERINNLLSGQIRSNYTDKTECFRLPPDGWLVAIAMASGSALASAKMGKYKCSHLETTNNLNSNTCLGVVKVMSEHLHCFKIHIQQEEKMFLKRSTVTKSEYKY